MEIYLSVMHIKHIICEFIEFLQYVLESMGAVKIHAGHRFSQIPDFMSQGGNKRNTLGLG